MEQKKLQISNIKNIYNTKDVSYNYIEQVKKGLWKSEEYAINKYFNKTDKIIDIGCGAGRTTIALYNLGYKKIQGFDLSETLINAARKFAEQRNLPIQFDVLNMMSTHYENQEFDVAFLSDCALICIPGRSNRALALKETSKIVKPNGFIIIVTPEDRNITFADFIDNYNSLWDKGEQDSSLHEFGDFLFNETSSTKGYGHFPTNNEFINFVNEIGLELCETFSRSDIESNPPGIPKRFWILKNNLNN